MDTIEHEIIARCLGPWSRAVAAGHAAGAGDPRLLVVDASGAPPAVRAAGSSDPHEAPLVRLLRSLSAGTRERTTLVALREDPAAADAERAALERAGWSGRARRADEPVHLAGAEPGDLWLLEADLAAAMPVLLRLLDSADHAFVHAAPASPAALPSGLLRPLLEHPSADVLIRLPVDELGRLARYRTTPVADLPLHLRRLAEGYSLLLGDPRWEWLAAWRAADVEVRVAQAQLAERLRAELAGSSPDRVVRRFPVLLDTADEDRVSQLALATHEPERVLELNRILFELRREGMLPWMEPLDPAVRIEDPGTLDLFPDPASRSETVGSGSGSGARVRTVDLALPAHRLAAHFTDRVVSVREVMRFLADSELFPDEVRRVLRLLRRERRATYTSLRSADDLVRFHAVAARPSPRRRPSRPSADPGLW